jgi:patatin-like phospholipase/acyl hydrolase
MKIRVRNFTRILSLDGGGVRGLISLSILNVLETQLKQRAGQQACLSDIFDWIVGTSTGGIIAIAMRNGMSVQEIRNIYMNMSKEVFRKGLISNVTGISTCVLSLR